MRKLAVIHYMPLEFYPPATNFLDYVSKSENLNIEVFSTKNNKNRKEYRNHNLVKVHRSSFPKTDNSAIIRLYKYFSFNIFCFLRLVLYNPDDILYYESYSAAPVYWYIRFFGKNKNLKIHNHEYFSPQWYKTGMRLVKKYHSYEMDLLYEKANWISQTNENRVKLFLRDNPNVTSQKMEVLPNYPPITWYKNHKLQQERKRKLRTVYIGSLSLESTYLKEYCEWVISQKGMVYFDLYSYNLSQNTVKYLLNLKSPYIKLFKEGIDYEKIPTILEYYDVGVILYKNYSANLESCAPNKLFEYMACQLEIWFSDGMKGCYPYSRRDFPRIISVDFNKINSSDLLTRKPFKTPFTDFPRYTAEQSFKPLLDRIQE